MIAGKKRAKLHPKEKLFSMNHTGPPPSGYELQGMDQADQAQTKQASKRGEQEPRA